MHVLVVCDAAHAAAAGAHSGDQWADPAAAAPRLVPAVRVDRSSGLRRAADEFAAAAALDRRIIAALRRLQPPL